MARNPESTPSPAGRFPARSFPLRSLMLAMLAAAPALLASTPGQHLTHHGRYERALDLNLGLGWSLPGSTQDATGLLGNRIGLSLHLPVTAPLGFGIDAALLYSTKALRWSGRDSFNRWTLSLLHIQLSAQRPFHRRLPWLQWGLLVAPQYALDLIVSSHRSGSFASPDAARRLSFEAGPVVQADAGLLLLRAYYSQEVLPRFTASGLMLGTAGLDLLLPLEKRRKAK